MSSNNDPFMYKHARDHTEIKVFYIILLAINTAHFKKQLL